MFQLIIILLWMSRKETFIANYKHKDYTGWNGPNKLRHCIGIGPFDYLLIYRVVLCRLQKACILWVKEHRNCGLSNPVPAHTRQSYPVPVQRNQRLGFGGLKRKDWIKANIKEDKVRAVYVCGGISVCCSSTYMGQNSTQT